MLYEAQSDVKTAYAFQQQELVKSGWKELEGGYVTDQVASGTFTRDGFKVTVTVTPSGNGDAVNISLMNHGNVDTAKLPVPAGCEPLYATPVSTAYVTAQPVPETAEQVRALLVAANWVPYGEAGESSYFKRNAVKLAARVTAAPGQGGKTVVEFSSEQMSADLPAPPKSTRIQYADVTKSLSFDTSLSQDEVAALYREVLAQDAWKATTENLIKIDFEHLLIFRNPPLDLLELKLTTVDNVTRGELRFQTKAEVDELEKQLKEKTATHAEEPAAPATRVEIPLPADARTSSRATIRSSSPSLAGGLKPPSWPCQVSQGSRLERGDGHVRVACRKPDGNQRSVHADDRLRRRRRRAGGNQRDGHRSADSYRKNRSRSRSEWFSRYGEGTDD